MAEGSLEQSVGSWAENGRLLAEGNGGTEDEGGGMECERGDKWQEVVKKNKRKKGDEEEQSEGSDGEVYGARVGMEVEEYRVSIQLSQEGHTFKDWSPLLLTKSIHKLVGEVKSMRVTGYGKLMIFCRDKGQQEKALKIQKLEGKKVQGSIPGGDKSVKGVISGVPLGVTMEEVRAGLKGGQLGEARRFKTMRNGEACDSLTVLLTFREVKLPTRVFLGYFSYVVRPYIPPPLRCYKCQKFGHVAAVCKGKQRCGRCAGDHAYGKCGAEAKVKCCNCGGEHSAAYKGCVVSLQAEEVQRMRAARGVTYAEAARRVKAKEVVAGGGAPEASVEAPLEESARMPEEMLLVSKTAFVLFMVDVVNCAAQTDKRTERIKIIVRSAERFLGIRDLTWEEVKERLNASSGSGEGGGAG